MPTESRRPVDPAQREAAVARLLDAWPWDAGGVVIGGYAVAAYGSPRYSDDLDVCLPRSALPTVVRWLMGHDPPFAQAALGPDWTQNYGGTVSRFVRGEATVDLLPGAVRDRDAAVDVPYEWIGQSPRHERLVLIDASTRNTVPIARPEALWALKLQSGRPQDLSDLFAIHDEPVDLDEVSNLFEELWRPTLAAKLDRVLSQARSEKLYEDSLSRWSRGSPKRQRNLDAWQRFTSMVDAAIPLNPS